ncbi:ATP-grasp fold amidoligase family protein [Gottschalkiaceae bacterium SANA]|nr:ATP-grasp fold amidoligase family protein [Gottschalkiaceae bacterium SANA]
MIGKIFKWPSKARMLVNLAFQNPLFRLMSDESYLKIKYRLKVGKKLNLNDPKGFNEKIQWLKIHEHNKLHTQLVDKYEVRSWVADKIGSEYLVPLIGVYEALDQIDFDALPDQYVLKCSHDSGGVFICHSRQSFDTKKVSKKLKRSLKRNYYYGGREWQYKHVQPRLICERLLIEPHTDSVPDYKFMCFNGKVKCSFVCSERKQASGLKVDFFDLDWNRMPFERHYKNSNAIIEKPKNYLAMIRLAEILAEGFRFVRVDFYEVSGRIYFGELTFHPGSGFERFSPEYYDELLGSWIKL